MGVWIDASTTNRGFAYARIDVPGPVDLWAVSLHLLTTSAAARATEAQQLVDYISMTVPAGDYLVVGGDLNTDLTTEPALVDLSSVVDTQPPWPADQNGNTNTSINRNHPHDWLFASPNAAAVETPLVIGSSSYPDGLVFDSRVYTPLTEVAPVLITDSGTSGMQHMPVVKDFAIPN
jgi:hypothetical protein